MSATKRRSIDVGTPSKRRHVDIPRLADLREGCALFQNEHNASRAKEKGILRSREASAKYEELEKKLFAIFKESGELDFPNEDWVFEVLPELNSLENETLDALLSQAVTHAKYERAARELIQRERARLEQEHDSEVRSLRTESEAEVHRQEATSTMRLKMADEQAREELDGLRSEATEKIQELEQTIEELEGTIDSQNARMLAMEEAHEARCERLREESLAAVRQLEAAQEETDLKREASKKLKEEIIDNDRLTVANLNRIKHLEALVEQHKAALEEADAENGELRAELAKSVDPTENEEREAEVEALRELLAEREAQVMSLTRRLSDSFDADLAVGHKGGGGSRRESFLDRFNLGNPRGLLASGA